MISSTNEKLRHGEECNHPEKCPPWTTGGSLCWAIGGGLLFGQ